MRFPPFEPHVTNGTWLPVRGTGSAFWHHWVINRYQVGIEPVVVGYETTDRDMAPIPTEPHVLAEAIYYAPWHLSPEACAAWLRETQSDPMPQFLKAQGE
jgi:hypothetical protein